MADDTKPRRAPKVTREQLAINRANGVKYCFRCEETKPFSEFHKDSSRPDGTQPRCKRCMAVAVADSNRRKAERQKNAAELFEAPRVCGRCAIEKPAAEFREFKIPKRHRSPLCAECEVIRQHEKDALKVIRDIAWKLANKEWMRNYNLRWQRANPEKCKEKHQKCRNKHLERYRARERENARSPKNRARERALYKANPQKFREKYRIYRKSSPLAIEKERARNANRRARKKQAEGFHTAEDIMKIRAQQKDRCAHPWCRKKLKGNGHKDHRTPLTKGGTNWPWNIQLLCDFCNISKHNKHPEDYAKQFGYLV